MRGEQSPFPGVQLRLMKFVAQNIKFDLIAHHPEVLAHFKVERNDREYQFFKERPLSIPIFTDDVAQQKIRYLHHNPIQREVATVAHTSRIRLVVSRLL